MLIDLKNCLCSAVLLAAVFVIGCDGSSTPPSNDIQEAVNESVSLNDAALGGAGPQMRTILQSDTRGEWAHVLVADDAQPKSFVGRGTYVVANEDEGRMWKLVHGRIYRIEGKHLIWDQDQHGGNRAQEKADDDPLPDAVKNEWDEKWLNYVNTNGFTVTDKN